MILYYRFVRKYTLFQAEGFIFQDIKKKSLPGLDICYVLFIIVGPLPYQIKLLQATVVFLRNIENSQFKFEHTVKATSAE